MDNNLTPAAIALLGESKHDAFDYTKLKAEVLQAATDTVFRLWRSQRNIESWEELTATYLKIRKRLAEALNSES